MATTLACTEPAELAAWESHFTRHPPTSEMLLRLGIELSEIKAMLLQIEPQLASPDLWRLAGWEPPEAEPQQAQAGGFLGSMRNQHESRLRSQQEAQAREQALSEGDG